MDELIYKCFHLFQRVVGFRLVKGSSTVGVLLTEFPSLSESSGFPTTNSWDTEY